MKLVSLLWSLYYKTLRSYNRDFRVNKSGYVSVKVIFSPGICSLWVLRMPIKIGNIPLFKQLVIRFLSSFCQRFYTEFNKYLSYIRNFTYCKCNAEEKSLGYQLVFEISYNGQMIFN